MVANNALLGRLFSFTPVCLGLSSRGGQRRSLVSRIIKQAEQGSFDLDFESSHSAHRSPRSNKESLRHLISSKLEEGILEEACSL